MELFDAPFLLLHGLEDKVTDPQLSQDFHGKASSTDKTIKLYDGKAVFIIFVSWKINDI